MPKKKTISVQFVKDNVNRRLAESACTPGERLAMISVLETILHETGNYRGFCYVDVPLVDQLVGVTSDNSRRQYF